jgi:hypothetical protein
VTNHGPIERSLELVTGSKAPDLLEPNAGERFRAIPIDLFPEDIVQLWFALRRCSWSSLAIVPAQPRSSALALARALSVIGSAQLGIPVDLLDATNVNLRDAAQEIAQLKSGVSAGRLLVVATSSVLDEPAGITVAMAAGACLLLATLGQTDLASARRTLHLIGRDRFIGCVAGRSPPPGAARDARLLPH